MVSESEVMDKQTSFPCLLALCFGGNTIPLVRSQSSNRALRLTAESSEERQPVGLRRCGASWMVGHHAACTQKLTDVSQEARANAMHHPRLAV